MNIQQVSIFSSEYRKGKKTIKHLEGVLTVQTNHDGSTYRFIHLELDRTKKATHRIPLAEGDLAVVDNNLFYIENIFLDPNVNRFILAVSPYHSQEEV